ncbi:uncharacterized protein LOC142355071 [Convolutriloba macropyga]|uniref:uncharacterized protein LOC142355071 n=1 Tax=Convolutriloba macropyga TaxID=536237 RepID=UPI003F526242
MANNNRRSGTGRHERAERETVQTNFDDVIAVTETTADKALNGNREEQFTVGYDRLSFSLKFVAPGIALFLLAVSLSISIAALVTNINKDNCDDNCQLFNKFLDGSCNIQWGIDASCPSGYHEVPKLKSVLSSVQKDICSNLMHAIIICCKD